MSQISDVNETATSDLIDYRDLIEHYSFAEHARRADEYFAGLNEVSTVARKPFAEAQEASAICAGMSAMLAGLRLFPGARILDFGAGTCWSSRILALLRCEVTAVDVSQKALDLGRKLVGKDALSSLLQIDFVRLEDERLPFPDGSFDRVLCFDALHHVPDQINAIAEFSRVLKDPGIIALHEPGPNHSLGEQSQYEMRNTGVIEGDVHIEKLIARARECGVGDVRMALYCVRPAFVDLDRFNEFLADSSEAGVAARLVLAQMRDDFANRRICFMEKGKPDKAVDSRRKEGLRMEFAAQVEQHSDHVRVRGSVSNVGSSDWLPSTSPIDGPDRPGEVNIGVHLQDLAGGASVSYYIRRTLSREIVKPGQVVLVDFTIPYPTTTKHFSFGVDLVAEHVGWFEMCGGKIFRIDVNRQDL